MSVCLSVCVCVSHRCNRPTVPVERVTSNSGHHGDQVYLVPLQHLQLAAIFRCK